MATNKERLEDIESNLGSMQDELQLLTTKFQAMETTLHQVTEDNRRIGEENRASIDRLTAALQINREVAPPLPREPRRNEQHQPAWHVTSN